MTTARSLKGIVSRRGFSKAPPELGVGLPVLGGVLGACRSTNSQTPAEAASTPHR